jgi:undecaprenyl-phosphate galactose phosphotransferase/putative colanic acid biosynthesis UDP-glucose lipid carrier transferase
LTGTQRALKRSADVCVGLALALALLPLMAAVAAAIKISNPRAPVIFRQRRCGYGGRPFVIYKFCTMNVLEDGAAILQAEHRDPRITALGLMLRRSSIDELPQLLNVVKGDMSLVGPRPHALAHDDRYKSLIAAYAKRQRVKPGITGWAQVNGFRGETARLELMAARVKWDLRYINNWSVWLDLRIMMRTSIEVVRARAAY